LAALKEQLAKSGTDQSALKDLQNKFDNLTNTYATDKTNYEKKLAEQKYEFAVKEKVNSIKFTSNSAKKAFLQDVINKKLQMEGDTLLGFDDFVNAYKEQDSSAFYVDKPDEPNEPKPIFSSKTNSVHTEIRKKKQNKCQKYGKNNF
jgi:Phage minor structural protein GP20.